MPEGVKNQILGVIREKRPVAEELRRERRSVERRIMTEMLARGESEKPRVVDGREVAPVRGSPHESIHAFGINGRSGYFRWKPGVSAEETPSFTRSA